MNILVNASTLVKGGGIQVGDGFIRELSSHPEHRYLVVCSKQIAESLKDLSKYPDYIQFKLIPHPRIKDTFFRLLSINTFLDNLTKDFSADAVFTIFGPPYWHPKVKHLCGFAKPQYIYSDSLFFKQCSSQYMLKFRLKRYVQLKSFQKDTDYLVTENPDVTEKLHFICPNKTIETVSNCYNPIFDDPTNQTELKLPSFDGITLLTVSAMYPHKNFKIIPLVAKYIKESFPSLKFRFVITLSDKSFDVPDSLSDCFVFTGKVPIQQVPSLYRQATFMFLPTLLECFSASWAEAMKMNVPILTSDLDFAHGICGEAAEYFDPYTPKSIGDKIVALYNNPQRQKDLISKGQQQLLFFQDNKSRASSYLNILENMVKK